jgi:uncharacterized damage-inducible protein DinB
MAEVERIADQLRRAFEGDAWHGPSLRELLADVDAEAASSRPVAGGHNIAEIVAHVTVWTDVVRRRLGGEAVGSLPPAQDWPAPAAVWSEAREGLDAAQRRLVEAVAGSADARLDEGVPGQEYSRYVMLHGAGHHALYHAGQIALLKRARSSAS